MAGIVLVTKPSILFHNDYKVLLNESLVWPNASYDWTKEFQKEIILWLDPRSKILIHSKHDFSFRGYLKQANNRFDIHFIFNK